jgi:lipoprotein-releasing system permease protein
VGLTKKDIMRIFAFQGIFMGAIGLFFGFIVGFILCLLFSILQSRLGLISGEVYRIDGITVNIRFIDCIAIIVATLLICFIATIAPARRGGRLTPMEGLRNE